jgi:hypothetical protein
MTEQRHNLPTQFTSFVGREKEVVAVSRLLQATRCLTVAGTAGSGKSRLALQVAAGLCASNPDGAWFIDLSAIADATLVSRTVAFELDLNIGAGPVGKAMLLKALSTRHLLLILSLRRCEVLVASGGMPTCPHCQQIVVTRDGHDRHRRQRFTCAGCGRDFTIRSASAFSGYRWPTDVILMACVGTCATRSPARA